MKILGNMQAVCFLSRVLTSLIISEWVIWVWRQPTIIIMGDIIFLWVFVTSKVHNLGNFVINTVDNSSHCLSPLIFFTFQITIIVLTSICNCSFSTSTFPSHWKKALINPLLKTPTPLTISDTRPIAILPEQSKIVEREAFNQLLQFLETNELLEPRQAC